MLAGSPVLLPQSSHSSSFSMPHPTSPLSCSFLPSPLLWLLGEASQQCHACHVRQIPGIGQRQELYPFIFGEDPAGCIPCELSETPPHLPPPPGGWLEEGLLLPIQYHLLPISWAGMQDKSILGWEWQGLQ